MQVIASFFLCCAYHCYSPADLKNPDDPHDRTFDPNSTNYPVGELKFPNSGALERCIFLFIPVYPWCLAMGSIAFFVEVLHTPLCNICAVVPSTTLIHDQACIRHSACLMPHRQAYREPDCTPRLFRPQLNMERMLLSAERVALPVCTAPLSPFLLPSLRANHTMSDPGNMPDPALQRQRPPNAIKRLVVLEARWILRARGCSLYIRPTLIGTRLSLGVSVSRHAATSSSPPRGPTSAAPAIAAAAAAAAAMPLVGRA